MPATTHKRSHLHHPDRERAWPLDARMAMFVLEAGGQDPQIPRDRSASREPCRIMGTVCDPEAENLAHAIVYVRDKDPEHLGFICQSKLPVGTTLWLNCLTEDGQPIRTPCHVKRSRSFMTGWHEGVLQVAA